MAHKAPGRYYREGISIMEFFEIFPDEAAAEQWFVEQRWPAGVACPKCGSLNIQERASRKPQPFRCRDCRKDFSVKVGTLMESSPLKLRVWLLAIYILTTNIKGTSSLKLHRDLKVTQKTAWFLAHRIRESFASTEPPLRGDVEVDEAFFGGKAKNMHAKKRRQLTGRGTTDKTAVVGIRERSTGKVRAAVVQRTDAPTLTGFLDDHADPAAKVYTDEAAAYQGLPNHETVKHGVGEYVRDQAHINGMESFWSLMKRGYIGVHHRMSPKHLHRYVSEFSGRHNDRPLDTMEQMCRIAKGFEGKRLRYQDLKADTGVPAYAE